MNHEQVLKAIGELRKQEKRKFAQSVDLIINLKGFDIKRESLNILSVLPYGFRNIKPAAFLNSKSKLVDTITKPEFDKYKGKTAKKLVKSYDFFLAHASLMPSIASTFGKYLGPAGKMPSPQLGIITNDSEAEIKSVMERAAKTLKIKAKEPSIKIVVAKESMKDEEIAENIISVYTSVLNALVKKQDNIKNVLIKFTMGKPVKVE